ncbi:hypothetical protein HY621_01890 [Candidatus Uhrbacteria bacterium]|nr:hypothetical protein [Candidatus Uhrbacteria bacterium]
MLSKNELKEILYDSLKELGLTENEIALYLVSLSLGPATITTLAKHMAIPRPNVYKVIGGLEKNGLAYFSERKKYTRTFMVESPRVVRDLLKKNKEELARCDQKIVSSLPDLLTLYKQGELPTSIRILQGKEQFLQLFFQIIEEEKCESQFFGSAHDFIGFISWQEEREWIRQRMQKDIKLRALLLPSEDAQILQATDAKELRETRTLDCVQPFSTSFQLFANKIILWQPKAPLAVLIEDEYITQMFRSMFEKMWDASKVCPK